MMITITITTEPGWLPGARSSAGEPWVPGHPEPDMRTIMTRMMMMMLMMILLLLLIIILLIIISIILTIITIPNIIIMIITPIV